MLQEAVQLIKLFYTIPVTTSTSKRTSSALRRVNIYLKTAMSQKRLDHALSLYVHKDRIDKVPL
jgi:hypothetical protein